MLHTIKKEGYMKKDKEVKFRTVAVPNEVYKMIKQIAEKQLIKSFFNFTPKSCFSSFRSRVFYVKSE